MRWIVALVVVATMGESAHACPPPFEVERPHGSPLIVLISLFGGIFIIGRILWRSRAPTSASSSTSWSVADRIARRALRISRSATFGAIALFGFVLATRDERFVTLSAPLMAAIAYHATAWSLASRFAAALQAPSVVCRLGSNHVSADIGSQHCWLYVSRRAIGRASAPQLPAARRLLRGSVRDRRAR